MSRKRLNLKMCNECWCINSHDVCKSCRVYGKYSVSHGSVTVEDMHEKREKVYGRIQ